MFIRLLAILILIYCSAVDAQEQISYTYVTNIGTSAVANAVVTQPASNKKLPAVVILHHSGGFDAGTTKQYADLLNSNGFITIEPIMFNKPGKFQYSESLAKAMGAVAYLNSLDTVDHSRISVIGTSYGANLSVFAATEWAQQKYTPTVKLHRVVSLYPVCWFYSKIIERDTSSWFFKDRLKEFPETFMDAWADVPTMILAGGQDDYNGKDGLACNTFKNLIPSEKQKNLTSVTVYQDATHGWDQGRTFSFHEPAACKAQGCTNTNQSNKAVTEQAKAELLSFLTKE